MADASPGAYQFAMFILSSEGQRILAAYGFSAPTCRNKKEIPVKLSARNQLKGTIIDIVKGATTSHIRIDIGAGIIVTASITNEAVDDLKLTKGKTATAVIKASDVMVGVD